MKPAPPRNAADEKATARPSPRKAPEPASAPRPARWSLSAVAAVRIACGCFRTPDEVGQPQAVEVDPLRPREHVHQVAVVDLVDRELPRLDGLELAFAVALGHDDLRPDERAADDEL